MPQTITILSAGAPKTAVARCAGEFQRLSGCEMSYSFATATGLRERVGGGTAAADIVIAPVEAVGDFDDAGRTVRGTGVVIGGVAAGVVVRDGAPLPDISSAASLKQAVLDADAVIYNEGSSGIYIVTMIERLGIAAAINDKTVRVSNGAAVMAYLVESGTEKSIGFGQVTEIRLHEDQGVRLAGALPDEIGNVTTYTAALLSDAAEPDGARKFLEFLATPAAKEIIVATGVA